MSVNIKIIFFYKLSLHLNFVFIYRTCIEELGIFTVVYMVKVTEGV